METFQSNFQLIYHNVSCTVSCHFMPLIYCSFFDSTEKNNGVCLKKCYQEQFPIALLCSSALRNRLKSFKKLHYTTYNYMNGLSNFCTNMWLDIVMVMVVIMIIIIIIMLFEQQDKTARKDRMRRKLAENANTRMLLDPI